MEPYLTMQQVVEIMSTIIEHLVKGEIMQMRPSPNVSALDYYLRKNFYKTASLMGHSCLAAAVLGTVRVVAAVAVTTPLSLGTAIDFIAFQEATAKSVARPATSMALMSDRHSNWWTMH